MTNATASNATSNAGDNTNASAGAAGAAGTATEFKVPEQFSKEPWAKDIKSPDDLWNKLSGAEKLIGRKGVIVPGENATPEEIRKFHVELGAPEKPDGYELKSIEPLKDGKRNEVVDGKVKEILHKHGIPKVVGEKLIQEFEQVIFENAKPQLEAKAKEIQVKAQQEKEYEALVGEVFGSDKDAVVAQFKQQMVDAFKDRPTLVTKLEALPNEALVPLMAFSKKLNDQYTGESRVKDSVTGLLGSGDLKGAFRALSEQKARVNADMTLPKHIRMEKVNAISKEMIKIATDAKAKGIEI